jgi:hypothetical protein
MTQSETNAVVVHKSKQSFSAKIGGKEIKMTFKELSLMETLINAVLKDYSGMSYASFIDENGEIVLVSKE